MRSDRLSGTKRARLRAERSGRIPVDVHHFASIAMDVRAIAEASTERASCALVAPDQNRREELADDR